MPSRLEGPPATLTTATRRLLAAAARREGVLALLVLAAAPLLVDGPGEALVLLVLAVTIRGLRRSLDATAHALDEVHQLHRTLVEGHRNAVYVLDPDGRFLEINRSSAELSGFSPDELIGRSFEPLIAPELRDETRAHFQQALAGTPQTYETALVRADGARVALLVTNVRIERAGATTGVYGIAADISAVARTRVAREASERRFRRLADSASDGIYLAETRDGERRVLYVNPALTTITGVPAQQWFTDPEVSHAHVPAEVRERIEDLRRTGAPSHVPLEIPWYLPDGELRWFELREVPYEDDEGVVVGVQGIVRDITDRVRRQEATTQALEAEQAAAAHLRRVDEMKNVFLQSVSHELRTPLTSVLGIASVLTTHLHDLGPDRSQEMIERVLVNAQRLERLLSDLLDVDRMSRGALQLRRTDVDLAQLTARTLDDLHIGTDHAIVVDLAHVTVAIDGPKVERVVENLVHNAVRHTPAGTTIRVRTRPVDGGAELLVEDDGPGLHPELAGVAFEPFTQGPDSATSANPGAGIGLSLVSRFAELHDGHVSAEERPGGGARFRVWLPSARQPLTEEVQQV